jgi:hypothetical protein
MQREICCFLFSLHSNDTKEPTIAQGQPRGSRGVGRRRKNENGRNGLTGASGAFICCVLFIVTDEKDASPIFEVSIPVREPARPSHTVLHFSADHGFMAHFAFWNQVF